jgi:hypothetical protein
MQLGRHLRELWQHRLGLIISIMLALLASVWSVAKISIAPPGIKPRTLQMAAANARALVDTPKSTVLDLDVNTYDFQSMTNRGVLVGNIMASTPVREYISRRAHIPAQLLQVSSPVTPDFPRALASSGSRSTKDILKSPNEYRLSIQANPTVPVLDVYAEAPTAKAAEALANGAVEGMQDYLRDLGLRESIPDARQVKLEPLGRAKGSAINPGVSEKVAILSFLLAFGMCAVTVLAVDRVRRGWRVEATAPHPTA